MVRALIIPAAEHEPITECEVNRLEDYQAAVGGWVEPVDIPALSVTVYVNEEGLLRQLPFNPRATFLWWYFVPEARQTAMLVGQALVTGLPDRSGDSTDVPSEVVGMLAKPGEWRVEVRTIGDPKWYRNQPARTPRTESARERVLDAAAAILVRDGADALTIASIAREADISKGGLFYHFPSKEDIGEGLVMRFVTSFDDLISAAGTEPKAATRAYLKSAEDPRAAASEPLTALLGALSVTPTSLDILRQRYEDWSLRLDNDGVAPHLVDLVRFTVDGIWLADLLDLAPITGERRAALIDNLLALID